MSMKTEEEFQKWFTENWWPVVWMGTEEPTGMFVHKSNDVKVENFSIDELRVMFQNNWEPVIIHPTWEEVRQMSKEERENYLNS